LLHIERAHAGAGNWQTAHSWVKAAVTAEISAADNTGLYFGAPAISFILHAATTDAAARYTAALTALDAYVDALTHRRIDLAEARMGRGERPAFAEYDLFYGLTGIGAHLLRHDPASDALERVLTYLVRLAEPPSRSGDRLPGWWVHHDPKLADSSAFLGGHANLGVAHGIAGPLALLAIASRRGITVDGHADAIASICGFLDTWRQDTESGPWWPQWITRPDLRTGRPSQPGPARPSWCYGTPGLARAQQLAAIAVGDRQRQRTAEHALAGCLSDPSQLERISDAGLCHGWAGLYQTVYRTARDALSGDISAHLPHLTDQLIRHTSPGAGAKAGLLDGDAGLALALHTAAHYAPPKSGWDTCLLIN
jgi:hypothetical protein